MHEIRIGHWLVMCTDQEKELLEKVSQKFNGCSLEETIENCWEDDEEHVFSKFTFIELNKPTQEEDEYSTSYFGEYGRYYNEEADFLSMRAYGVYFNILMFLDNCDTYFRSDNEEMED